MTKKPFKNTKSQIFKRRLLPPGTLVEAFDGYSWYKAGLGVVIASDTRALSYLVWWSCAPKVMGCSDSTLYQGLHEWRVTDLRPLL